MISNNLKYIRHFFLILISVLILSAYTTKTTRNLLYNGFTAIYDVSLNDIDLGVTERRVQRIDENQYSYFSKTYATGVASWFLSDKISESSQYELLNNKITPIRYEYRNSNGKPNDNFSIIFDNKKNTVIRTKDKIKHDIANNKQDVLSFQLAIMLAMQKKNKLIKYTIIDNESINEYSLKYIKNETLDTDKGSIETQVMESNSPNNKDRYIFWCAPKYDFLPVKIQRIEPNGSELLIQLNQINKQKIQFTQPSEEDY